MVEGGPRPYLAAGGDDCERVLAGALEGVGHPVPVIVRGRDGAADGLSRPRVLVHAQGHERCHVVEGRPEVARIGCAAACGRPWACALGVRRPHLHLIRGARIQARYLGGRLRVTTVICSGVAAVLPIQPGIVRAPKFAVLYVVVCDLRPGVARFAPGHVQALARACRCGHPRGGRYRRRLVQVVDSDRKLLKRCSRPAPSATFTNTVYVHEVGPPVPG